MGDRSVISTRYALVEFVIHLKVGFSTGKFIVHQVLNFSLGKAAFPNRKLINSPAEDKVKTGEQALTDCKRNSAVGHSSCCGFRSFEISVHIQFYCRTVEHPGKVLPHLRDDCVVGSHIFIQRSGRALVTAFDFPAGKLDHVKFSGTTPETHHSLAVNKGIGIKPTCHGDALR